ncbi:lactose permease [Penicillium daleae]|uniref:Lactose permease n=1 Tax=Penicillium daleae TaxID=63821 RepID=A0AAD6FWF8_9EURO|nr:lactose permease [Penicillium daleae]KAJ5432826.1 lactose permease [Penicillium daleae]
MTSRAINHGMFMGGRFILGFGVCFVNVSGPVYVGSIVAAWVVYGTKNQENGWRIPLYCQFIASGIVVLFAWWLPESPRWLVSHGRIDSARDVLARYYGEGDREHPLVKLQLSKIEYQISTEGSDKR